MSRGYSDVMHEKYMKEQEYEIRGKIADAIKAGEVKPQEQPRKRSRRWDQATSEDTPAKKSSWEQSDVSVVASDCHVLCHVCLFTCLSFTLLGSNTLPE